MYIMQAGTGGCGPRLVWWLQQGADALPHCATGPPKVRRLCNVVGTPSSDGAGARM